MISLKDYRDDEFVNYCNEQLVNYTKMYRGIETALLATPDGFEIASYASAQNHSPDKLAAVGSSLFALGASLISEFNLNNCKSVILESDRGKVYLSTIENSQLSVVLMIQTNHQAMLGNIIHGAKKLNENITQKLNTIKISND